MKSLLRRLFGQEINVLIRKTDLHQVRDYILRGFTVVRRVVGYTVWVATR